MKEKQLTYKGSQIFYRVTGTGNLVMLLHGFSEDGSIWQSQVDFLKDKYRLIIPDIPGSGRSALINDADIETYAEIIKLILDAEAREGREEETAKVALIGHSMGGYIALAFAEKFPAYLSSLGLFHSSAFPDDAEKKQTRSKAINTIETNGAYPFIKATTAALFTKDFAEKNSGKIEEFIERNKDFSAAALIQYYRAMMERPDRTDVLKTFPLPVLFIIGEHDTAIPLQTSLQQCYLPTRSHVHILSKSAHMGMLEETDKSNKILLQFLQQQ